jgi:neutral ceramidase
LGKIENNMSRAKILSIVAAFVVINALGISLTVVNKGSYKNSLYHRFTRQRFAWIVSDPLPKQPIQAGWARETFRPEATSTGGAPDSVQTRVLVLDNGTTRAVMITVDLILMPPSVAQALEQRLPKLGFVWKNVYLGCTYSNAGLGGWAKDYMGERTYGPYNEQQVNRLTETILKAVASAQKNKATVQIGYTQLDLKDQKPLPAESRQAGDDPLHLLQLRKSTGESALVYSGSARQMPADSTGHGGFFRRLTQTLDIQTAYFTLGVVGPVQFVNSPGQERRERLSADRIVAQIRTLLDRQPLHTDSTLIAQTAPLIQNDPHVRISQSWRLKPWLTKALYGDYPAELKALRIGRTVFLGCPAGMSVELANDLLTLPVADQRNLIITSFNGGNIGPVVPDRYYFDEKSPYALSGTNRFGPHTAEFFEDMTQSLVSSLK